MWDRNTIAVLVKTINNRKNKYLHVGENDPRRVRYGNYLAVLSVANSLGISVKQYRNKLKRIETHVQKPKKPKVMR